MDKKHVAMMMTMGKKDEGAAEEIDSVISEKYYNIYQDTAIMTNCLASLMETILQIQMLKLLYPKKEENEDSK